MEARYHGFAFGIKAIAFVPSLACFIAFFALIFIYGRVHPTKVDPYGGRLIKRPKSQKPKLSILTVVKMKMMGKNKKTSWDVPHTGEDDSLAASTSDAVANNNKNVNNSNGRQVTISDQGLDVVDDPSIVVDKNSNSVSF